MNALSPSCQIACPISTDIPTYIRLLSVGRLQEAYDLIREVNPLPGVVGRICHHPCEQECRRVGVDVSLSCASLKRFIVDNYPHQKIEPIPVRYEKKVAVIGSGPAGLSAAYQLVKLGYRVAIFEKEPTAGGMPSNCIPAYRLPRDIIRSDIEFIERLGVEIRCETQLSGGDSLIGWLIKREYQAVLLATGLPISKTLNIPGIESEGVLLVLPFLRALNSNRLVKIGKRVTIIGGGNVAIDGARSARRLGAEVALVCLETREEMPALEWEIEEAIVEGVKLYCSKGPKSILNIEGKKIIGLECMEVKSVFDSEGRFSPSFYPDRTETIDSDTIIIAIGQGPDYSFLKDAGIDVKLHSIKTDKEAIFACGDLINGPTSVVEAIASGKEAADCIHKYLMGENRLVKIKADLTKIENLLPKTIEKIKRLDRQRQATLSLEDRLKGFEEVNLGFTKYEALGESKRCLSCGQGAEWIEDKCILCLTCVRICPIEVPKIMENKIQIDLNQCQACGICQASCPANAIKLRDAYYRLEWIDRELEVLLKGSSTKAIGFCCAYTQDSFDSDSIIKIPCLGRLERLHILRAYELGARRVFVISCIEEDCKFTGIESRITQKMGYTKKILGEIGIDIEERFQYSTKVF